MWGRYCIFQLQCCCGSVFLLNIMNSTSVTRVCCSKSRTLQSRSGVINSAVLSQIHGALMSQLTTDPLHQSTLHDWKHSRWLVTDWRPINTDTDGGGGGANWCGRNAVSVCLASVCAAADAGTWMCACLYACLCICVFMRSDFYAAE